MEVFDQLLTKTIDLIPTAITIAIVILFLWITRLFLNKQFDGVSGNRFRTQVIMLILSFVGLLVIILTLPVSESTIGQLLSLFGILLSAAIALSATTFVGNIMAGLMLRAIKNFRPGDFVRVGDHFGRVSERGLFHIEIQTEDRDLTTLPNLYLVTNPVKVILSSGTLMTADVSLGYDTPRAKIEKHLINAAVEAGLQEPFVHIIELGDFSVTYRIAGLLIDVKSLISSRSILRAKMMDHLHHAGIEIVSPTFMNQRPLKDQDRFIPPISYSNDGEDSEKKHPEDIVFDKADEAESIENLQERKKQLKDEIETLKSSVSEESDEKSKDQLLSKKELLEARLKRLNDFITERLEGEK